MEALEELSTREKTALVSLLAVLFVYGSYFADLLSGSAEQTLSGMLYASVAVIVALVIIQVVFHAVLGAFSGEDANAPADERDRLISSRAAGISHHVLSAGVVIVLGSMVIGGAMWESVGFREVTLFEVANLLLFALVLSELVFYGAQLYFYRRGIAGA
jgi:hypothetical protein